MVLIPGLPDDLARECLARVNYSGFSIISLVCKAWKSEFQLSEFYLVRKQTCNIQKLIVASQFTMLEIESASYLERIPTTPVQVTFLEPETGVWSCLPPVPDPVFPNRLPVWCCEVVSCISSFVLLVGLQDWKNIWKCETNVFVFDFLSSTWRRGAELSDVYPVSHGCTFDGDHMVYALCRSGLPSGSTSIEVYDTVKDKWTTLSDMSSKCNQGYRAIFHRGKIHIACREDQNVLPTWKKFINSLELLRVVCEDNGKWYGCSTYQNGEALALRGSTWEAIAKLPDEVRYAKFVTMWEGKLVVIGAEDYGWLKDNNTYMLDLKDHKWTRVETPTELRYIYSACTVEI